jgi:hypothetical protein
MEATVTTLVEELQQALANLSENYIRERDLITHEIWKIQLLCPHEWDFPEIPVVVRSSREFLGYFFGYQEMKQEPLAPPCPKCQLPWAQGHKDICWRCGSHNFRPDAPLSLKLFTNDELWIHEIFDNPFGNECISCSLIRVRWDPGCSSIKLA